MEQSEKRQTYILISLPEFEIIINHKGKRLTLEWSYRCIDWCKLTEEWWIWLWKVSCNRPFLINYCSLEAAILDVFYVYIIMWGGGHSPNTQALSCLLKAGVCIWFVTPNLFNSVIETETCVCIQCLAYFLFRNIWHTWLIIKRLFKNIKIIPRMDFVHQFSYFIKFAK